MTPHEIGDQDLAGEAATPPAGTSHVGKAVITPTGPVGQKVPPTPQSKETAGTDADTADPVQGTTDAARPGSTKAGTPSLPPPDRTAAAPLAD
ncbi:hypothetical protein [Limnoglobus roseus]|uniref:Uncharacterized protein n=1 Tax=Limnoglobus roseus TaxID=2598579 RepID=A0A5C1ATV5_9BACT|nr:hypothetical protein [Limnoglobus roseus]QEL20654.1 hypothetical protein PX52LOC_07760 [Limnoglobus roseus]